KYDENAAGKEGGKRISSASVASRPPAEAPIATMSGCISAASDICALQIARRPNACLATSLRRCLMTPPCLVMIDTVAGPNAVGYLDHLCLVAWSCQAHDWLPDQSHRFRGRDR